MADGLTGDELNAIAGKAAPAPPPGSNQGGFSADQLNAIASGAKPASAPAPTAAPEQGYIAGLARTLLGQGAAMSWGDEIVAALRHVASGEDYNAALADERAKVGAFKKQNPKTAMAAELGGALLTPGASIAAGLIRPGVGLASSIGRGAVVGGGFGGVSGAGAADDGKRLEGAAKGAALGAALGGTLTGGVELARGVQSAAAGMGRTGAYNRFASQLPEGVDTFANQVATGAARNNQGIQRRTLDILGQEMERAGGDRGQAVASAVARIQNEFGVTAATAQKNLRDLTSAQRDSTLMLSEYPAAAGANAAVRAHRNIANVSPQEAGAIQNAGTHNIIDTLANGAGAQSSAAVRNAVESRNLGSRDAMRGTLGNLAPRAPGGGGPRTIVDLDQMQEGAVRAAKAEYQAAYAPGNTNDRLLLGLLPRIIDRHLNRMAGRSGDQAQALNKAINEFKITRPNGQTLTMMTLQQLQDARGAVRGQIEVARRAGQDHIVNTLQPLYNDVTRLMKKSNLQWAKANRRWADDAIDTRARELGEAFATKAGPQYRRQLAEYQGLAPEAQQMVQVEYLQKLADKLDNIGDTHDVAKLFTNDHTRNSISALFGHEGTVAVAQMVRDLGIATRSGRMLGGSQTAARLARSQNADIETGILAAAENASLQGAKNWLTQRLLSIMTERRNQPLAEIATTPMNDMAEVARHIHNMRTAQQYQERIAQPNALGLLVSAPASQELGSAVAPPPRRIQAQR